MNSPTSIEAASRLLRETEFLRLVLPVQTDHGQDALLALVTNVRQGANYEEAAVFLLHRRSTESVVLASVVPIQRDFYIATEQIAASAERTGNARELIDGYR